MSNKQHDVKLGALPARYPTTIAQLNQAMEEGRPRLCLSEGDLKRLGEEAFGECQLLPDVITDDGYRWWWTVQTKRGLQEVKILLPRAMDESAQDGTHNDRSCAVIATGFVSDATLERLVRDLAYAIVRFKSESASAFV